MTDPFSSFLDHFFDGFGRVLDDLGRGMERAVEVLSVAFLEFRPGAGFDSQQRAVYDWHHNVIEPWCRRHGKGQPMSLEECRALVNEVYGARGLSSPIVTVEPGDTAATGSARSITLPPSMMRRAVVLHEAAHGLVELRFGAAQGHGPEFVTVFCVLMQKHAGANWRWMVNGLRKRGIRYADRRRLRIH